MFTDIQIAPSILSADFANLERDVRMISAAGADWIHVDVMDGHFVPNLTIGPAHVKMLKRVTDVPLDVHLMIDNPEVQVPWYIEAGADSVTVHVEVCDDAASMLRTIRDAGVKVGISLNPETDVSALEGLLGLVDLVLVMSVHPGFGGQSFIESSPAKIAAIVEMCKAEGAAPLIEVDGGIGVATAPLVRAAGADVLVAGSAIFCADDPAAALRGVRDACR
ncbi:MAG TPA: ribulose-phosphate 3-epimerase [Coriobacteriaceae bacterium]|nr:ribulose-phosphate 3-epimerase [Coriobacteriaceae bacterium]